MQAPTGMSDLLESERGAFATLLLVAATVLVVLGKLDSISWLEFMKYLAITLIASKTVTTAVETVTTKEPQIPSARVAKRGESS